MAIDIKAMLQAVEDYKVLEDHFRGVICGKIHDAIMSMGPCPSPEAMEHEKEILKVIAYVRDGKTHSRVPKDET
jgi:hypothetical protein